MLLITAECDPLSDDCDAFAQRVREEGGEVDHRAYAGLVHGFFTLGKLFPQANAAVRLSAQALRERLCASDD
jgi:acetyl esterase